MVDGCFDKLLQLIEENAVIIAAVALGIAALEVQETLLNNQCFFTVLCTLATQLLLQNGWKILKLSLILLNLLYLQYW